MARLVAPDKGCIEVDVGRRRYHGNRIDVTSRADAAALKAVGYIDPGPGGAARTAGYVCPACGFRAFFIRCSRCGTPTTRGSAAA